MGQGVINNYMGKWESTIKEQVGINYVSRGN